MTYAGPSSRLTLPAAMELARDRRYGFQVKADGVYASIHTDASGRIASLISRRNRPHQPGDVADLIGLPTGLPDATLHGELEAQTEHSIRARSIRGYPVIHLFDISAIAGCSIADLPYSERYSHLHRWQSAAECYGTVPRRIPMVSDDRTFRWALPSDGITPMRFKDRPLAAPGAMVPGSVPYDLRRLPIVPLVRGKAGAEQLWHDSVHVGGGEGLVAVRLDARLGARASKLKVKPVDHLDCLVLAIDCAAAILSWRGHVFSAPAGGWMARGLAVGDTVEAACDGFYDDGVMPKFPRIVRARNDKVAA